MGLASNFHSFGNSIRKKPETQIELSVHRNPFHGDVTMFWLRDTEQECWIYFWVFNDGSLNNSECNNCPDVDWQEVPLDCPDVGN